MVNVDLYSAIITKVSNALNTLVSREKPGFQALSKGLILVLCAEVVRQGVPDHGACTARRRLLAVCWPGAQSARDNHALACNFAKYSQIKKNSLTDSAINLS